MELLQPVIRPYAWGSRTGIAELQGRPVPAPGPEAELWMGAHPSAPSGVAETTLDAVIAADPDRELGPECVARFGPRLPFLLKVLSADQALSIQVHPSRAQAQAGFRARNVNYVDDWPKPELLCALTPFEVLAGLRPPQEAAALLRTLSVPQLAPLAAELQAASTPDALSQALATILDWPEPSRPDLITSVTAAKESPDLTLMEAMERNAILQMLKDTNGNKLETAKRLGIGRQTLYNKIKIYGIEA